MDVLFISPSNSTGVYQDLSKYYAAIEPPTWALLLAESCRSVGYRVAILAYSNILNMLKVKIKRKILGD